MQQTVRFSRTKPKPFVPDQIMRDWIKGVKEDDDDDDDEEDVTCKSLYRLLKDLLQVILKGKLPIDVTYFNAGESSVSNLSERRSTSVFVNGFRHFLDFSFPLLFLPSPLVFPQCFSRIVLPSVSDLPWSFHRNCFSNQLSNWHCSDLIFFFCSNFSSPFCLFLFFVSRDSFSTQMTLWFILRDDFATFFFKIIINFLSYYFSLLEHLLSSVSFNLNSLVWLELPYLLIYSWKFSSCFSAFVRNQFLLSLFSFFFVSHSKTCVCVLFSRFVSNYFSQIFFFFAISTGLDAKRSFFVLHFESTWPLTQSFVWILQFFFFIFLFLS